MNSSTPDVAVSGRIGSLQGSVTQLGDWLTVERMVYACLTVVALALRLIGLGWSPLGPDEAQQALRALDAARVLPFDMAGVDPALYSLQRLLFSLFGATEFAARLWPALIGGLSVLCFYAFRSRLGRTGALMAAALWAISPVAVFTSRLGYGDALVPALALTAASALELAWQRSHSTRPGDDGSPDSHSDARRYTILAGVTVGLMLASGGNAYTVMAMGLAPALIWRDAAHRLWRAVAPSWKAAALALGVTYALSATFVFMSPDGFAAAAALPGEWARDLVPWFGEYAAFELVGRLVMTEIVVIVLGLVGLGIAARRRDAFGLATGLAAGIALLPVVIGRGRHSMDLVLVVLPLVFLAGPVGARVFENFGQWWSDLDSVLLAVLNAVLLLTAAFCLPGALNPANTENWRQIYLIVGSLTLILAVLQWFAYGIWGDWRTVARVAPLVPLMLGIFWTLSQSIGIGLDHGAWRQANPLHERTGEGYFDLADELEGIAALQGRGNREVSVDLVLVPGRDEPLEPVLRWLLRDYPLVQRSVAIPLQPAPIVITAAEAQPALADLYGGADFSILEHWQPSMLDTAYARLRWVLFREARIPPGVTGAVLWVRRQPHPGSEGVEQAVPASPEILEMPSEPLADPGEVP